MKNRYRFLKADLNRMIKHAVIMAKSRSLEICGLLIFNGYFVELVEVRNKVKTGGAFEFYVREIRFIKKAAEKLNHEIIGTFHSHPLYLAEPDESDIAYAEDDSIMLIIDALDKEAKLWHIKNFKKKEVTFELI